MSRLSRPILAWLTTGLLLLEPATSMGESVPTSQVSSSAALNFRITIPPIMRVLENSHPTQMASVGGGDWSGEQRLVVVTNMKRGFCVSLRMSSPAVNAWRLQTEQAGGITLNPVSDGYQLCTPRAGRYTLLLQHEFEAARDTTESLTWPVQTDITAL